MIKKRVLSGIQPSGKLHLGNLVGALQNWVELQDDYDCFFFIADYHALTTGYDNVKELPKYVKEVAIDLLSVGLTPEKCTIFKQSDVVEHCELHLLFSMITPLSWLERVPTYKSKIRELKGKDLGTYGFLGYPVLQAVDILLYKPAFVPVGEDQLPHLEITREIARRFNHFYGSIFPDPKELLTHVPVMPGLDGRKMSKSYGNTIALSDSPLEIKKKVNSMITDPARVKKEDEGHPDICTVFSYYKVFNKEKVLQIEKECKNAFRGCVECKKEFLAGLLEVLKPIQENRKEIEKDHKKIQEILCCGAQKAKDIASKTLKEAKKAMGLSQ
ncbi:tryptophan--tRNA ligase [candidate division WOR-1 bacterium RIFOXYA2_FULL_36_21]|uniref:Tryptophan--tRNA ligase n=1 Tax=candidate division WOR-1 bacterium RIFOXYB2_FULL_36_35 TaxID=1802578 RepID=A0A1F4S1Z4_UNCSA|nr:MAG: tryptophan--tRNA ligase [candidate division WOR-1 bacterium RIFOXYA2_FULL_36_21]OGC14448.1 MAG: tryptophan--tRNA ligase [candidate division WOR-1 bacterium RIFOXYB2_FULL_36_35]OGC18540.1 MAG: tryptophan--tRNA ligase [candidate division WOR-1 bacterium RIFOXYA12_FULL_36_13]